MKAVAYATSTDGKQSSGALPLTLTVGKGGRKFFFHGDLNLPKSMVGSKIKFAIFVGFNPKTGNLEAYPKTAPQYAKTGKRETIRNYPVALQAKAEIAYRKEAKQGSYHHLGLRFGLVGSLIRCALTNNTDKELTVTGLELHGLGATGLKLAKPTKGTTQEVFVTSDEVDPSKSFRTYTLPAPKKLTAGAKAEYYLVYAPLVSQSDGRSLDYQGYVRPILSDKALQAEYADDQTAKALPSDRGGKLVVTNIVLEAGSPIKPNAIPLQYWNNYFYYKPSSGSATVKQPAGYKGRGLTGIQITPRVGYPLLLYFDRANPSNNIHYYFNSKDIQANAIASLGQSVHVPTKAELDGILLPGMLKEATDKVQASPEKLPFYYQSLATYTKEFLDSIEVGGKRFLGKSSIWRDAVGGAMTDDVLALLYRGWPEEEESRRDFGAQAPVYVLRYGKLSPSEIATGVKDFKGKLARDNKSRVAYVYYDGPNGITIFSCYIGDDPTITTAKDLHDRDVFLRNSPPDRKTERSYRGHKIYYREIEAVGALYSSRNVNGGARQLPLNNWTIPAGTPLSAIFPSAIIPSKYIQTINVTSPSSGMLYRKTSSDNDLVSGWFYRSNEGQIPREVAPLMGWTYNDRETPTGTITKYTVKDLPTGGDRYFAFPLWLMSDAPSTAQY